MLVFLSARLFYKHKAKKEQIQEEASEVWLRKEAKKYK